MHTPPLAELFMSARGERLLTEVASQRGRGGAAGAEGGGVGGGAFDPVAVTAHLVRRSFTTPVLAPRAHAQSLRLINKR